MGFKARIGRTGKAFKFRRIVFVIGLLHPKNAFKEKSCGCV